MRGTTPYDRRGTALTLPNGSLDNPSLRFGGARSGVSRTDDGDLAVTIKQSLSLGISDTGLLVRSNTLAPIVTPLALDRANATLVNGEETTLDIQELGIPVARLAAYRESGPPYFWGWRLYGFEGSGLGASPLLQLSGSGTALIPGSLVVNETTALQGPTYIGGDGAGSLTVTGPTTFTNEATFAESITVAGDIVISGDIVPEGGGTPSITSLHLTGPGTALEVDHNAKIDGTLTVVGAGWVGGNLTVQQVGVPVNGLIYFGNTGTRYLLWDGADFRFTGGVIVPSLAAAGSVTAKAVTVPLAADSYFNGGNLAQGDLRVNVLRATATQGGAITGASLGLTGNLQVDGAVTLPTGSVAPSAIGNLTIAEASPTVDTNTIGALLNNLAHRTMSIIGVADWKGAIPASSTLTDLNTRVTAAQTQANLGVTNAGLAATAAAHAHPYAATSHSAGADHDGRYSLIHSHPYAASTHPSSGDHDSRYSLIHSHPYAASTHPSSGDHDSRYSLIHSHPYAADTHNHTGVYAPTHSHPYAADSHPASGDHDGRYVNVTGDTMSGALTISVAGVAVDCTSVTGTLRAPYLIVTNAGAAAVSITGGVSIGNGLYVTGGLSHAGSYAINAGGVQTFGGGATPANAYDFILVRINGNTYRMAIYP